MKTRVPQRLDRIAVHVSPCSMDNLLDHPMITVANPVHNMGGAGTGLSAKCEEAGGIDLIVIYNSGRYRMAGRGSLSSSSS